MKFENKEIVLKNGESCVLTPTTGEYAEEMIEYLTITAAESPFLLRYPDEITFTIEDEVGILDRLYESEDSIMMLALVDGKVAGNGSISGIGNMRRIKHRCSLAIALKKDYWGLGIGKNMMDYMLELAKECGYEQVELGVIDGNDRAKSLYEKCGFTVMGRNVNAFKYDDGTLRDEILMYKTIK